MRIFVRWLIIFIALILAARIVPGIAVEGTTSAWFAYAIMAVVLGLVNVFIKPLLKLLSCGLIAVTFGLFLIVINAFVLWLSAWICTTFLGIGIEVTLWGAVLGSIVVSLVSWLLDRFVRDEK
jgi:putative membrane protein